MPTFKFSNPKKSHVIIFDHVGSEVLEKMILGDIDHEVLHARHEVFYITPPILFYVLKNLRYIKRMSQGEASSNLIKMFQQLPGTLYRIYLLSCVQYIQPKVVLTFIDNSYSFQLISRIYKRAEFIAVQNGVRSRDCLKDSRPSFPQPGSIISMPILVCFGKNDVDSFESFNHKIDHYYPLGSLKARYFKTFLSKKRLGYEFDLCLLSEWDENILAGRHMPNAAKGLIALDDFLSQYIKDEKVSLCIALRTEDKKEEEYFINKYGERVVFIKFNKELMSSYDAIDRSMVTVAFFTTLAREAFGWGAKVFSCNVSGDDIFSFPCKGFWSLEEKNYELFKNKLNSLRMMDMEEFHRQSKSAASYIMNNEGPAPHEFLRRLILERLTQGSI